MAHAHAHDPDKYYIPHGSNLPFYGSASLFVLMAGAALYLSGVSGGGWVLLVGLVLLFALFQRDAAVQWCNRRRWAVDCLSVPLGMLIAAKASSRWGHSTGSP